MFQIERITNNPNQKHSFTLENGLNMSFILAFKPMQQTWFFEQIVYQTFTMNSLRVCNNPNLLYQWVNLVPFGIACFSSGYRNPELQDDFVTGYSRLYILSQSEIAEYRTLTQNG